jgi:hypothetical protein
MAAKSKKQEEPINAPVTASVVQEPKDAGQIMDLLNTVDRSDKQAVVAAMDETKQFLAFAQKHNQPFPGIERAYVELAKSL